MLVMRAYNVPLGWTRGPPRSSLESFSAWVESLDKILKDLQALDGNRGTWGSKLWIPFVRAISGATIYPEGEVQP